MGGEQGAGLSAAGTERFCQPGVQARPPSLHVASAQEGLLGTRPQGHRVPKHPREGGREGAAMEGEGRGGEGRGGEGRGGEGRGREGELDSTTATHRA